MFKRLLIILLCFSIGGTVFYWLTYHIKDVIAVPIGMMSVLLLPLGYCSQAITKFSEIKESTLLSYTELERLEVIVAKKIRLCIFWIGFYVFSAILLILAYYLIPSAFKFMGVFVFVAGGSFGVSICSIFFMHFEIIKTHAFKSKIIQRDAKIKRQVDMQKKLFPEGDNDKSQ